MPTNNVNDLSLETRKAIRDKAISSWMTADQVKTQLEKVWITQTNPVVPVASTAPAPIPTAPVQQQAPAPAPASTPWQTTTQPWIKETVQAITPEQTLQQPATSQAPVPAPIVTPTPITSTPKVKVPKEKLTPTQKVAEVTPPTDLKAIQTVEDWKKQTWWWLWNLESWLEARYWTVATQEWDKVTALIWDKKYQWNLDEAGNPIKTELQIDNPDDIYNMLSSGQTIPETLKTSKVYSTAKARYDISSKYNSYTEDQLYSAYVNWEIWSQLEKDLVNNPYLVVAKERYNKKLITDNINKDSTTMLTAYNKANWKEVVVKVEEKSFLEKLSDKINESFTNKWNEIESFKSYMSNNYPDLVNDTKDLNQKNLDLKKLVDERDARLENIIKENPWISLNRASMLAARQNKDVNDQIKSMSYEIWNLQANINFQTEMANKEYGYELQNQERQDRLQAEQRWMQFDLLKTAQAQDYQTQQIQEERAYNEQQIASERAYNEKQYQQQLKDKFDYEYWDLNSTNPQVQKVASERIAQAIQKQYEWMPFRRDVSVMWADILNELKSGKTIEQITTDITNAIQNAPAYEQWAINNWLIAQPQAQTQDWSKLNDWTLYNQKTGDVKQAWSTTIWWTSWDLRGLASQFPWQAWAKNNNPAWITWNTNFDNPKPWTTAYALQQAWIKYSMWTARPSNEWWNYVTFNTIEDWLKAQQIMMRQTYWNSTVNQMLQKWVWTSEWPSYAKQVAWDAWINLNIKVSDLSEEQLNALQMAKIKKESPWLAKLLTQTSWTTWWPTTIWKSTTLNYTDAQLWVLSSIENLTSTSLEAIKEVWLTVEDFGLFKNWWLKPTSSQIASANAMVSKIDDLIKHPNLSDAVWAYDTITPTLSWKTNDFKNKFNAFIANLAKDNLGQLKWPMSDKDIQFIKDMSSVLNTNTDEDSFIANLKELKKKYSTIASWKSLNESINTSKSWWRVVNTTWWRIKK